MRRGIKSIALMMVLALTLMFCVACGKERTESSKNKKETTVDEKSTEEKSTEEKSTDEETPEEKTTEIEPTTAIDDDKEAQVEEYAKQLYEELDKAGTIKTYKDQGLNVSIEADGTDLLMIYAYDTVYEGDDLDTVKDRLESAIEALDKSTMTNGIEGECAAVTSVSYVYLNGDGELIASVRAEVDGSTDVDDDDDDDDFDFGDDDDDDDDDDISGENLSVKEVADMLYSNMKSEGQLDTYESQGFKVSIDADGTDLVFSFKCSDTYEGSDLDMIKESLESGMSLLDSTYQPLVSTIQKNICKELTGIKIYFFNGDGTVLVEASYK